MKNALLVLIGLLVITAMGIVGYVFRGRFNKKPAGLSVNSSPKSEVFLNGESVGTTPYDAVNLTAGVYSIKLVPESTGSVPLATWETKMDLTAEVTTAINRNFAESEADSSGSILQMVKEPGGKTFLSVISEPDTINLTVDGVSFGFTPVTKIDATPGSHLINFSSPGYKPQDLTVEVQKGFNLIINVKLAADTLVLATPPPALSSVASPSASASASPAPSVAVLAKPYCLIKETGTGWLRVRKEPSSTADELGKANTGEMLQYLGESTETGWHKVEFEKQTGWVSGKYTDLVK